MKPYGAIKLSRQTEAQQTVIGPDVQECATLLKQSIRYAEKVLLELSIYHNQSKKSVAEISIAKCVISDAHKLNRILSGESHPSLHQAVPAHCPRQLLK
jgi:hypothetical protein